MIETHRIVGILVFELNMPQCGSLKEKRRILNSLKDRIKNNFNVSISEIDMQDKWQRAILGIAAIGGSKGLIDSALSKILNFARDFRIADLVDYEIEIL